MKKASASLGRRLWDKDASLWKRDAAHTRIIRNSLGWLGMPETMSARLPELTGFAAEVSEAGFLHAAVLGMGGSSLAPEVFRRTFPCAPGRPRLHVLDSTHPGSVAALERAADPAKTLYIVSSKSGTTVEPSRFMDYFLSKAPPAHFAAITDPGTELETLARKRGFRKVFLNFPDIGGRYSALSYFGLVPAALMGVDLPGLLENARAMARACGREAPDGENPGARLGAWLAYAASRGRDKITFLISPGLDSLGLWLEQLIAESVGKEGKGVVPICGEPALEPDGYGADRAFVHIRLRADESWDSLTERLQRAGHPVLRLDLQEPLDLGGEFFRWEVATAVLGHLMKIDPFDQPDVQSAKERTQAALTRLSNTGSLPLPSTALSKACRRRGKDPETGEEALRALLSKAKPGAYLALLAYLPSDGGLDGDLAALRRALLKAAGIPVQMGYGPRYLHSTGQLHKGGPDAGLFLLLGQQGEKDLSIPGAAYTFGQLCCAQALGDFAALDDAGRRAVFLSLEGEAGPALRRLAAAAETSSIF